jgi:signal transduction histidine kinase
MNSGALVERLRSAPPRLVDGVQATVLLAIDLGGWMTTPQPSGGIRDSDAVAVLILLLASVPITWRRRYPIAVLSLTFSALTLHEALGFPEAPLLGPYVALYSVGAHHELGASARAAAAAIGVYYLAYLWGVIEHDTPPFAIARSFLLVVVAWGLGASARKTRTYAAALEDRARRLERMRDEEARRAVAEERARIARELHDVIAHHVSVMVVQAGGARRVLEDRPARARAALESIESTGREALSEMRRLLGFLRASDDGARPLEPQPGLEHLDVLVAQLAEAGLPVRVVVEGEPRPLAAGLDLSAYRIVQEALTNSFKHAGPAHATVRLRYGQSQLDIEVSDDGRGPVGEDQGGASQGQGLLGMRERVALFGGELRAGPGPDGGYAVVVHLPLEANGP